MIEIIPAILPHSFEELEDALSRLCGVTREVQLDVVDGHHAAAVTWPLDGGKSRAQFERIAAQEEGLPFWEDFDFEVDLMLKDPLSALHAWTSAGVARIVIHADSDCALEVAQAAREEGVVGVGIALRCDAPPAALAPFHGLYDYVQVMGIATVGYQGQPPDERALALVRQLRALYPDLMIQVDGGVRKENIRALRDAGVNRLIVGSAILKSSDPARAIKELQSEANA